MLARVVFSCILDLNYKGYNGSKDDFEHDRSWPFGSWAHLCLLPDIEERSFNLLNALELPVFMVYSGLRHPWCANQFSLGTWRGLQFAIICPISREFCAPRSYLVNPCDTWLEWDAFEVAG